MGNVPQRAFTSKYDGLVNSIVTEIRVSAPFKPTKKMIETNNPQLYKTSALWDTGATHCAIKPDIVKKLGLKPVSKARVKHAGGISDENVYLVNLFLPNGVAIPFVRVTEASQLIGDFEVIIGMQIITLGDFSLTNVNNKTIVSFRMPSTQPIDYVQEINDNNKKSLGRVGRNDPCPCGSGKKYKHCHGR